MIILRFSIGKIRTLLVLCLIVLPGIIMLNSASVYGQKITSLAINLSGTTIAFGQSVTVSATLSGATKTAGGTVTYNLYPNGICMAPIVPLQTDTETVTNRVVPPTSTPLTPNAVGTFSVKASYTGDVNNFPSTSPCKQLNAVKTATTVTTASVPPIPATITIGGTIKDTAILSGANIGASTVGTVVYTLYSGSVCTGPPAVPTSTKTVVGGIVPDSDLFTINTVGTYSLRATYSGDTKNQASSSPCETPVSVTKATGTTLATVFQPVGPITAGTAAYDTATLGGTITATAGGTVTYTLYSNGACTGSGLTSIVTVTNAIVPNSKNFVINNVGTYSFKAVYSGDASNAGATANCEASLTVTIATPTMLNTVFVGGGPPTTITVGQSVTDSATLVGATSNAGGTVTYTLYREITCVTALDTSTVTVTNDVVPNSKAFVISDASHVYGINAVYTGDANNNGITGTCEQPINVNKATPTLSTQLSATQIFTDQKITDSATLTGASTNAAGSVTYQLYSDGTCTTPVGGQSDTEPVTNGIVPSTSTPLTPTGAGTFSIKATYTGDANNNPATSTCEVFTVVQHSPSISTQLSAQIISFGGKISDSATLTNFGTTAGGTVTYSLYASSACVGPVVAGQTDTETVTNGVVPSTSTPLTPNGPGPFGIQAVYSGDANNKAATSSCESFTVRAIIISTQLSASQIFSDAKITDSATLSGVTATAGGTVTYNLYPNGLCTGGIVPGQTDSEFVVNGVVPPTSTPLTPGAPGTIPGPFSIQAVYSGDGNNAGATSSCEVFTVVLHSPTLSTQLGAQSISFGGKMSDSATLTNAGATAGGSVTYSLYSNSACTGSVVGGQTDTETVTNGVVPSTSTPLTPNSAGIFGIQAVYTGDSNNNPATSSCESFTVRAIIISTQLSASVVSTAQTISDQATLGGITSNAGGTVTYRIFAAADCSGAVQGGSGALGVTNGVAPNSGPFTLYLLTPSTGPFGFQVVYSGDANNAGVTSPCEPFSVVKASPTLSTQLSRSTMTTSQSVTDTATLSGATPNAGGTVTFTMYTGSTCSGSVYGTDTETVTNDFVPTTGPFFAAVGSYSFRAVYSGDSGNNPATSACNELLTVTLMTTPIFDIATSISTPATPISIQQFRP